MPRGDKSKYTDKQKRQAENIEESYKKRGVTGDEAEARAWATVNRESGGGKKSGSGRGSARDKGKAEKEDISTQRPRASTSRKGTQRTSRSTEGTASDVSSDAAHSAAARKAAETRARNKRKTSSDTETGWGSCRASGVPYS